MTLENGESIEATEEHPFYVKGKGWNPASSLQIGQALVLHDGTTVVIREVDTSVRFETVYNLTVANAHTYFVGRNGALVHNIQPGNPPLDLCKLENWINPSFRKTTPGSIYPGAPERLPPMKDVWGKTAGILKVAGVSIELLSGDGGPNEVFKEWKNLGDKRYHVETHTAGVLRLLGKRSGTLYLNNDPCGYEAHLRNPSAPIWGCYAFFADLLPVGTNVKVYFPHPFDKTRRIPWDVSGRGPK